jgi:hypothetical protein
MKQGVRLGWCAAILALSSLISGCVGLGSATLPPDLSAPEKARVRLAHLPLTIGVVPYQYPAYSDALVRALQRTKLFDRVELRDHLPYPPSLVAEVEQPASGTAVIPFATLLSFGIIPTTTSEDHGYNFSFHSPNNESPKIHVKQFTFSGLKDENQKVVVDYRYQARITLGWVALLRAWTADEVLFNPESHARFRDTLSLAILKESEALTRLAEQGRK